MEILRWDPDKDGPLGEPALRRKLEKIGYRVSRYDYPPGTYFPAHTHGVDKIDAVLAGQFRITMGEESVVLGPGDAVAVPVVSLDAVKAGS
jgi:quercetin dioxygenase-like cupin family protein